MARASALHAEGQRFDSVILHPKEHNDMMEARPGQGSGQREKRETKRVEQTSVSSYVKNRHEDGRRLHEARRGAAGDTGGARAVSEDIRNVYKGAWGMPRLSEAKKDVTSCEKPGRGANTH